MKEIFINTEFIRLNQLLKLAGILNQGSDVRFLLEEGRILLNGRPVSERGRKGRA